MRLQDIVHYFLELFFERVTPRNFAVVCSEHVAELLFVFLS